ncbi:MAG: NADH-quinone oxidoreductase subunit N [Janthinobacterium lividum]
METVSNNLLALLPEYVLTVVGVLIMLLEPVMPAARSRRPLGWFAAAGTLVATGLSLWQLHLGIMTAFSSSIRVDSYSVFFQVLIGLVAAATLLSSLDFFGGGHSYAGEYYALVCFGTVGMMLMCCSTELLMVFVGLEISSIATYIMAGFRKGNATSAESSLKYFLLGSFATAFFLYGIALTFGATGSTNLTVVAASLATTSTPTLAVLAIAMIIIGIGFKVSAAPFHVWTPDVYQGAPPPVVGFMSTAPKAAAFAVLLRILFSGYAIFQPRWQILLAVISVLSMCIGNLGALLQRDVKRMLAYSSIAHAGYLIAAFTALPTDGIAAVAFYSASYAAMNVGAFIVITLVSGREERLRTGEDYAGLAQRHPVLGAALSFFLLSMIGIPFTAGFFGKFYVFTAVIHTGHITLAIIGLLNSGVACFYYLRLIVRIYSPASAGVSDVSTVGSPAQADAYLMREKANVPAYIALAAAALATLLLGVAPGRVLSMAQTAGIATAPAGTATKTAAYDPAALR